MSRPLALALGGGAGLGWVHIGILRSLQERGVRVTAVAGTSIGALVGACFVADQLDALETLVLATTRTSVLRYLDVRPYGGGMLGGQVIARVLRAHLGDRRIEDLPLPFAAVAADLRTGLEVVLGEGSLVEAVQASIAIPGIFRPVVRGERLLADGGLVSPAPVRAARQLSAAPVLAVNLQGDYPGRALAQGLAGEGRASSALGIARASMNLLLTALARAQLAADPPDLVLAPAVGSYKASDFTKGRDLIALGHETVALAWPAIAALTQDSHEFA